MKVWRECKRETGEPLERVKWKAPGETKWARVESKKEREGEKRVKKGVKKLKA